MDGIDAAIILTNGFTVLEMGTSVFMPYSEAFKEKIRQLIKGAGNKNEVEKELTNLHAAAVEHLLKEAGETPDAIDLIGFHGHTIDHRPHDGITVQIGDGDFLSKLTGINVVNDFRTADVKAGGQGAPLVPIYHQALLSHEHKPVAVVNIGGVGNVTWIGPHNGELLAFDTGPGNALIDDWVRQKTGKPFDNNGGIALSGKVDTTLLHQLMQNQYFNKFPPKSLDRNHFTGIPSGYNIILENGAATLAAFTVEAIAQSEKFFPHPVTRWIIAGGGRHNAAIMRYLKKRLHKEVIDINALGFNGDMIEAQAFAFLAVRSVLGLPISFPGTTGVKHPLNGGTLHTPNSNASASDF